MTTFRLPTLLLLMLMALGEPAAAFCGFYVARADAKLFNKASQVVLVRDGPRTVVTMASDFQGSVNDFAMVVPVPTFITREQIHVTNHAIVEHLDAYTAPRLVEYFDPDPCARAEREYMSMYRMDSAAPAPAAAAMEKAKALGVTIEASYSVGEYDIQILSATQSGGLITWLKQNGYRIPDGAEEIVGSYLARDMRFFVAKVNMQKQQELGFNKLRPLQIAYESPRFMLPIRLGTVNSNGDQELFIYALTRKGRVQTTNYRTVELPSGSEIPAYVKADFSNFYQSMFSHQTEREQRRAVFLEYAWDMNWCDPCAADPLSQKELQELGVFWLQGQKTDDANRLRKRRSPISNARNVFVTRLHVRYDAAHFPEDLMFQETGNRKNFQARFVIRHAYQGPAPCEAGQRYLQQELPARQEKQMQVLANLTGWGINDIRPRMDKLPAANGEDLPSRVWWDRLWAK